VAAVSVCHHRPEECGSFTPCGPCRCGQEYAAEQAAAAVAEADHVQDQELPL
jgi:hypothetical protein